MLEMDTDTYWRTSAYDANFEKGYRFGYSESLVRGILSVLSKEKEYQDYVASHPGQTVPTKMEVLHEISIIYKQTDFYNEVKRIRNKYPALPFSQLMNRIWDESECWPV